MEKRELIRNLMAAYRVGNASDSDISPERESWSKPEMAGEFCRALDYAFRALNACGVLSNVEVQEIYDAL
jgi:hypothetical protein